MRIQRAHYVKGSVADRLLAYSDRTGECWEWTASRNRKGYGFVTVDGKPRLAHRVAYELEHGRLPKGMLVDHTCHNPGCVNPDHLRAATNKQNLENRLGATVKSASGVRGVHWNRRSQKWAATVGHFGRIVHVGYFDDIDEAERAVVAMRNQLFTHNLTDRTT